MKEYTYNELVAMQAEAKQRVMEMQKKSRYALEDMNRVLNRKTETENSYENADNRNAFSHHSIPVAQQAKAIQYPTGIVSADGDKHKNASGKSVGDKFSDKCKLKNSQKPNDSVSKFFNVFGRLSSEESEKMLVLALCILLSNEQADENLIMALLYLIV